MPDEKGDWTISEVLKREIVSSPAPSCTVCMGLIVVKDDTRNLVPCPVCQTEGRQRWLLSHSGLEGDLLDATVETWQVGIADGAALNKQRIIALNAINAAIAARHGLYTFYGDFGAGKTRAVATVCNELRFQMTETYYTTLAAVLDHLKSLYQRKVDTSIFWDRLLNIPVLALDEVTRFSATSWAQEKLFLLVNTRYMRQNTHLTLFATNADPTTPMPVDESLGYLISRMNEHGNTVVKLQGDMRPARKD